MRVLLPISSLFIVLLCGTRGADECNDRCKYGEVCLTNGTCVDKSELVYCGIWSYCLKGQDCCQWSCIPANTVCCNSIFYCSTGHTCCGAFYCCAPGSYCDSNEDCRIGINPNTTAKPQTTTSVTTSRKQDISTPGRITQKPVTSVRTTKRTTTLPQTTRYVTDKNKYDHVKSSSSKVVFLWWHGLIVAAAVILIAAIFGLFLWKRRTHGPANASGGKVLSAPPHNYQPHNRYITATKVPPSHDPHVANPVYGTQTPQTQQHLEVTKAGVPPYAINAAFSPDGTVKPAVDGQRKQMPTYNVIQTETQKAVRPQSIKYVHSNVGKTTKQSPSGKPLPHL